MYLIFLFLLSLSSFLKTDFDHFASGDDKTWIDESICKAYQAEVISEDEFPKSRLFLTNLVKKYPKEFANVSFYKVKGFVPFAGMGIIGIPYEWLVMLENEVCIAQKWAEWALLHEAGHIHHQHVKVMNYLNIAQFISNLSFLFGLGLNMRLNTGQYFSYKDTIASCEQELKKEKEFSNKLILGGGLASFSFATLFTMYSKHIAESQADDFASQKCQDKEALEAAVEWLNGCTTDHPNYPTVEERVEKIKKAIKERFSKN